MEPGATSVEKPAALRAEIACWAGQTAIEITVRTIQGVGFMVLRVFGSEISR
jgi:hypothetical protein